MNRKLPNIPFHATPLLRAHGGHANLDMSERKRPLAAFNEFVQHLPIERQTFVYKSPEFKSPTRLQSFIRRDLAALPANNLECFLKYDHVKIHYDKGQPAVTFALQAASRYALSKQAYISRDFEYRLFRLAQVADYLCAIELTAAKYDAHCTTPTGERFFGKVGSFKKNWLKQARRKQMK